jgi:hypothetical protein
LGQNLAANAAIAFSFLEKDLLKEFLGRVIFFSFGSLAGTVPEFRRRALGALDLDCSGSW